MAVYKVAQDVEADDKLIGPFSFRQFIYLIIVAIAGALAFGLSKIFVPLAVLPLPIIIFFGALALPLRKDQPMEVYLAALLSFYLKPRRRLWIPDGIESLVEITAPKTIEIHRAKDITESEAERRLSYLADIADTGGWAIRHTDEPFTGNSMIGDAYFAAQQTPDVLDSNSGVAQSLSVMINQSTERNRRDAVARMQQAAIAPAQPVPVSTPTVQPFADPYATLTPTQPAMANPVYNPYPTNIRQSVIQPLDIGEQLAGVITQTQMAQIQPVAVAIPDPLPDLVQNTTPNISEKHLSPDIINLANNADLSIETIAREAGRMNKKSEQLDDGEVFISLH